ncbi:23S rRNA (guanosine(2251)-2'-O)-methyltransferase RlmB [Polyangium jinanense]|uniref:23S rRNA (Guanosine(2251)-2'-O)-methyltransferase RlmB n=1 Tax=Polyangium jinanense TaxID=2829994 RepID=A0A9X3XC59_9BACT|nr:23S rRNA (guanosine(2251)-2'-O)-methyltransferase RlmB [Polyangium jinanense]MDC3958718.1 23S rRNA (guanosine(2251)-2'-O)-methyltransferase RlmB [Polyangium jinanense]MDC3985301.1 23S rRNA (guanosine(2251)-2'-O)-methyltransferase RlmB [Polyangium jinanense]
MSRLVYGLQPVREAVRVHGDALERVVVEQGGSPKIQAVGRFAEGRGVRVETAPRAELDRRTGGGRHQGVVAVAPDLKIRGVDQLAVEPTSIVVALDGIMDPQNFGAIVRSAVALGATGILWPEHSSAPLSPAMFRASAGAIEHAMLCRVSSLPEALRSLADRGVTVIALDAQGPTTLGAVDLRGPVAIVIGAEDKGARKPVLRACQHIARLPMAGPIGSLNASVAGALALYEVLRQRQVPA